MGNHDVVLTLLPNMGTAAVAGAAASIRSSFSNIKIAFLVGVCGGVPSNGKNEALLGDVVISKTIQHGIGKQYPTNFVLKETVDLDLGRSNKDIRSLVVIFETEFHRPHLQKKAGEFLKDLQGKAVRQRRQTNYDYPGVAQDILYKTTYRHQHHAPTACDICSGGSKTVCKVAIGVCCTELGCDKKEVMPRNCLKVKESLARDDMQCPEIFIGRIASGDTVMKSGEHRDRIAAQLNVIAFEMEGAGLWDELPCIVIKGICDYADSHKNKIWQPFAAATAASVMKAVLGRYARTDGS
ncbi:nucleoside phosphorylase domain-containing protein [Xylariales sp. PMI_506]|nr:nucleoside phosphorylase domain-containing protein [Xylariales sp. PMI_506]